MDAVSKLCEDRHLLTRVEMCAVHNVGLAYPRLQGGFAGVL